MDWQFIGMASQFKHADALASCNLESLLECLFLKQGRHNLKNDLLVWPVSFLILTQQQAGQSIHGGNEVQPQHFLFFVCWFPCKTSHFFMHHWQTRLSEWNQQKSEFLNLLEGSSFLPPANIVKEILMWICSFSFMKKFVSPKSLWSLQLKWCNSVDFHAHVTLARKTRVIS